MPRLSKKAPKKEKRVRMEEEMEKFKEGEMHSGSKRGPKVKSRKQAIAIGLSESGQSRKVGKQPKIRAGRHAKKARRKRSYKR